LERLIKYMNGLLKEDEGMMSYLRDRGITEESIDLFMLGKFPDDVRDTLKFADSSVLADKGILYSSYEGIKSQFTQNKLIFPIYDINSIPVAIAGRVLVSKEVQQEQGLPKYTNSVYKKTQTLFGLNLSKDYIREAGEALVVEGYTDFISAYQNDIRNIVAVTGTILSNGQMNLLARYTDKINLLYDNDKPGDKAVARIREQHKNKKINVRRLILNKYNDLDELIRSGEDIKKYITR